VTTTVAAADAAANPEACEGPRPSHFQGEIIVRELSEALEAAYADGRAGKPARPDTARLRRA